MSEILTKNIEDELVQQYMNYSMSVIIGRAIPDVRDGLKPVQRRILYVMHELGLTHNAQSKKCARIVGEVLGKYHPHGDMAVYDALVRLAQPFTMRYPLIIGQGNFGSVDRDPPAAMRYTEAKLSRLAEEMLEDLDKETVDMQDNFDGTLKEPTVLPSKIPNLLLSGSSGIAVGMATNIPPHNLVETVNAIQYFIKNPQCSVDDLMKHIKGPDFPTGGIIVNANSLREIYATGRGKLVIRSKVHFEEGKRHDQIVVTEIPYGVSKAALIEEIARYAEKNPKIQIKNIRDESDKKGLRIVIEIPKNGNYRLVLNNLYKHTSLQTSFNVQMLVIDNKRPKLMNLLQLIRAFVQHRFNVIRRRSEHDLKIYSKRAHILEGIMKAARAIGSVVDIIRSSKSSEEAIKNLINLLSVTEEQAKAILDMRLGRLTSLEIEKLKQEYSELVKKIEFAKEIISNDSKVYEVMYNELEELKHKYGDERRTQILNIEEDLDYEPEDLIPDEDIVITLTEKGYIKATSLNDYRSQKRGGKGIIGARIAEDDGIALVCATRVHSRTVFVSSHGRAFVLRNHEIELSNRDSKGKPIRAYLNLEEDESVLAMIPFNDWKGDLLLVTKKGKIKRTPLSEFESAGTRGIKAITFEDGDCVVAANVCDENDREVLIITRNGMSIRFSIDEVRCMGRTAMGVSAVSLRDGDEVVGMVVLSDNEGDVLTITTKGFGKRTPLSEYRVQSRGGVGIKTMPGVEKVGFLCGAELVKNPESDVIVLTKNGHSIRFKVSSVSVVGRTAKGVKILELSEDDEVSRFAVVETCTDS
ncbi:DNA gyrase subunit A [Thermotoga sp. Ku-13t]|uniref:DNA gyrase subunit A n=1 Tax=Thermotoga sp. Ku-13t TaxID=1755813 RepID=UPI0013EB9868|nr:DNA gyrase subunit A [Thermotoga sp. Ku-13t]KAF2958906.1 DNA gyrase subunit A [Thermotoga sp. Ku-13t]